MSEFSLENYVNKPGENDPQRIESDNVATEFFHSFLDAAVVKKVKGVAQLFGAQVATPADPQRTDLAQLAHVSGEATGEILDFILLTKLAGSTINRLVGKQAPTSALGSLASERSIARHAITGGAVGLVNGSLLTQLKEGENPWRRLGNGAVEAGTFATLGGVSTRTNGMLAKGFWSRVNANAVSGGAAGLVHTNLDAWTHGRLPTVDETMTNTTGWALGNVAFGEGAHALGHGAQLTQAWLKGEISLTGIPLLRTQDLTEAQLEAIRQSIVANVGDRTTSGRLLRSRMAVAPEVPPENAKPTPAVATAAESEPSLATKEHPEMPARDLVSEVPEKPLTPSDRGAEIPMVEASESISMRELAQNNDPRLQQILEAYHPELAKAFPLEGEIESIEVYLKYLKDPNSTWDMVILCDKAKNIIGGIQYQIVAVNGEFINKAAWGEHIWLKQEARNYTNFRGLIKIAEKEIQRNGGEIVFMEFNNPEKMTQEQILEDASAGISPKDREKLWGRVGIHVPVDSTGNMLEYGQPSMGPGLPEVPFLTLGFMGSTSLSGKTITKGDYLKLCQVAHATIDGVNIATDPTVLNYTRAVNAMTDDVFTYVPLSAISRARDAALAARTTSMTNSIVESLAKSFVESLEADTTNNLANALHRHLTGTPESLRSKTPDVLSLALRQAVQKAVKQAQSGVVTAP